MSNLRILILPIAILCLSGCSKLSTGWQNSTGVDLEAYYSTKTNVVCFTTSRGGDNIYCLPADKVKTKEMAKDKWVIV